MGAGRKTETVHVNGQAPVKSGVVAPPQRKLAERNKLASVVFGCNNDTQSECVTDEIFGLPKNHASYVVNVLPGMPLFLFNYSERKLHGIFEATTKGGLYISEHAWTGTDYLQTKFPAQVKVKLRPDFTKFVSLSESLFKTVIIDNYYDRNKFFFELDREQTERLIQIFESKAGVGPYRSVAPKIPISSTKWQTETPTHAWKRRNEETKLKEAAEEFFLEGGTEDGTDSTPDEDIDLDPEAFGERGELSTIELDSQQTERFVQRFESKAGVADRYRQVAPKNPNSTGQIDTPSQVWKGRKAEAEAEVKQAAEGFFLKGETETVPDEDTDLDPEALKDERGDLPTSNHSSQNTSEAEMSQMSSRWTNAQQDHSIQRKPTNNYKPSLTAPSTSTASQREIHDEIFFCVSQEAPVEQVFLETQTQRELNLARPNYSNAITDWERMARERSAEEQALMREERENVWTVLKALDSSVAMTVKTNLELYATAIAQMRQDDIEVRLTMDEAKMLQKQAVKDAERLAAFEKSQAYLTADIQDLTLEVDELRRQLDIRANPLRVSDLPNRAESSRRQPRNPELDVQSASLWRSNPAYYENGDLPEDDRPHSPYYP